jgi:hypothetical protein
MRDNRDGRIASSGDRAGAADAVEPVSAVSSIATIPCAFDVPEGLRFEYRFSFRAGRERHDWNLIGVAGAVGIWAEPSSGSFSYGENWYGGVEVHSAKPFDYSNAAQPSQELCWLLLKPCWHDGSSLFFSERIEHAIPEPSGLPISRETTHRLILGHARSWFDSHLASAIEAPSGVETAQTGSTEGESAVPEGETPND